jgi:hypothetical protein
MTDKSPHKSSDKKKPALTLKEKRTAKKAKSETKGSVIPPTGH